MIVSLGVGVQNQKTSLLKRTAATFNAGSEIPSLVLDFTGVLGRGESFGKPFPILGPELVTNGNGELAGGWSPSRVNSTITSTGGRIRATASASGSFGPVQTLSDLTVGALYQVSADTFTAGAPGNHYLRVTVVGDLNDGSRINENTTVNKSHSLTFIADGVTMYIGAIAVAVSAGDYTELDNVSVREVIGYRAAQSNFAELFPDFSRSGSATMVDSDGLLKWAPHNLLTYSEDLTNAAWPKIASGTGTVPVITAGYPDPEGGNTAFRFQGSRSATGSTEYSLLQQVISTVYTGEGWAWVRSNNGQNQTIYMRASGGNTFTVTPEWQRIRVSGTLTQFMTIGLRDASDLTCDILIWRPCVFRSDLGGMVDNPDTGDSYVPTTSAAKYLARRNHHVFNGTEWENKGLLVESEARTNLILYSGDLFTGWTLAGTMSRAAGTLSPDGVNNWCITTALASADRIHNTTGVSVDDGVSVTGSLYFDASQSTDGTIEMYVGESGSNRQRLPVTVSGGEISIGSPITGGVGLDPAGLPTIEEMDNGIYRISLSTTNNSGITKNCVVGLWATGNMDTAIWGAQVEVGLTPSSYIPTDGATATRSAETLTIPSALLPFHPDGVWMSMGGLVTYADEDADKQEALLLWGSTASYDIEWNLTTVIGTGRWDFRQTVGNVEDGVVSSGSVISPGVNAPFSLAARHGPTYVNGAFGGAALTPDLTPTALPDLRADNIRLAYRFNGVLGHFTMGAGDPGDAGIAEASA